MNRKTQEDVQMNQGQAQNSSQGAVQTQTMQQEQTQTQKKEMPQSGERKKQFSFSFDKEQEIDKELRKPRSRAYMEVFDAIDMLSTTDEEIIAELKANMDEDTAEEFSNMTAEEILEEIKACFQEEFQNLQIEVQSILHGVLSKCYINDCDCHAISAEGNIMDHYNSHSPMPDEFLERGRMVFRKYPSCRCVEVYSDCCRVVAEDSTVLKISNSEIG